jgi:hypothetical protein
MRRSIAALSFLALFAAQLQFTVCTVSGTTTASSAIASDAAHAHHHAAADADAQAGTSLEDGGAGHQRDACAMLARCQLTAVPVHAAAWSLLHECDRSPALRPAAAPENAHLTASTPPPRSLS